MSKFIGDKRVETEVEDGDHVVLTFKDGSMDRMSKKLFEVSTTRHPSDATSLYDRQLVPVVKEVLDTLFSWDVRFEQLSYFVNMLQTSLQSNADKANEILWGKKKLERRMSDIEKVLRTEKDGQ